jgi:type IV pilus assembly protein PilC
MPKFKYIALDSKGKETQGEVDADTQIAALGNIREKGFFPTSLVEIDAHAQKKKKGSAAPAARGLMKINLRLPSFLSRVKPKQMTAFTRQLATLVNAGLPLLRGLQVLNKQEKNPALKRTISEIAESIEAGSTFAEALSQHPRVFNKLFVNMAKAGEIGGVLDVVLLRLSEFMEKAQKIKNKIVSAMAYPVVVLIMAMVILAFLMVFIVPKFQEIFKDLLENQALPGLTQFVLAVSRTMTLRLPFVIIGIVALIVSVKLIGKTRAGRYGIDRLKLSIPIFGALNRKTAIGRFTRTLGTLMTSGVPVLQALNIVRDTVQNEAIGRAISLVHDSVKEGENMAPPIEASGAFPPIVVSMIEVGEETGELPEMLMKIADNYDDEVDNAVAGMTSIIEPILIICLALIVGTIVISLFLPLISIIGKLS